MKYILNFRLAGIEPATPRSLKVKLLQSSALPNELKSVGNARLYSALRPIYYKTTSLSEFDNQILL